MEIVKLCRGAESANVERGSRGEREMLALGFVHSDADVGASVGDAGDADLAAENERLRAELATLKASAAKVAATPRKKPGPKPKAKANSSPPPAE